MIVEETPLTKWIAIGALSNVIGIVNPEKVYQDLLKEMRKETYTSDNGYHCTEPDDLFDYIIILSLGTPNDTIATIQLRVIVRFIAFAKDITTHPLTDDYIFDMAIKLVSSYAKPSLAYIRMFMQSHGIGDLIATDDPMSHHDNIMVSIRRYIALLEAQPDVFSKLSYNLITSRADLKLASPEITTAENSIAYDNIDITTLLLNMYRDFFIRQAMIDDRYLDPFYNVTKDKCIIPSTNIPELIYYKKNGTPFSGRMVAILPNNTRLFFVRIYDALTLSFAVAYEHEDDFCYVLNKGDRGFRTAMRRLSTCASKDDYHQFVYSRARTLLSEHGVDIPN